jgi:hypothetical protein
MFSVHVGFSCTYHVYELTKLKKSHGLSILLHLCIQFQVQTHYSLAITKNIYLDLLDILSFYDSFVTMNLNLKFY